MGARFGRRNAGVERHQERPGRKAGSDVRMNAQMRMGMTTYLKSLWSGMVKSAELLPSLSSR